MSRLDDAVWLVLCETQQKTRNVGVTRTDRRLLRYMADRAEVEGGSAVERETAVWESMASNPWLVPGRCRVNGDAHPSGRPVTAKYYRMRGTDPEVYLSPQRHLGLPVEPRPQKPLGCHHMWQPAPELGFSMYRCGCGQLARRSSIGANQRQRGNFVLVDEPPPRPGRWPEPGDDDAPDLDLATESRDIQIDVLEQMLRAERRIAPRDRWSTPRRRR